MESIIKDLRYYAEVLEDTADDLEELINAYDDDDISIMVLRTENAIYYLNQCLSSMRNLYKED